MAEHADPGLTPEQRALALVAGHWTIWSAGGPDAGEVSVRQLIAALRAAIEDCALVAEAMAFDAIAARIRRLKEG